MSYRSARRVLTSDEIPAEISALPKADLHLHAEAGPRLDRLFAARGKRVSYDWDEWSRRAMTTLEPGMPRLLDMAQDLINAEDDAAPENFLARIEMTLSEAAASGGVYAEVRFGRETILREDFMTRFREAERNVRTRFPRFLAEPLATLIPQQNREQTERLALACIRTAEEGLAGVDLIPDPYDTEADWSVVYPLAERLASAGLGLTIHAGEFSTANLAAALKAPGIRRIGHGIHASTAPDLIEQILAAGVALECCVTSNVVLGGAASFEQHPLKTLADAGIPVTVNTDNPVRFRTSIEQEYARATECGMTVADLANATRNAIEHSFTTPERRRQLLGMLSEPGPLSF